MGISLETDKTRLSKIDKIAVEAARQLMSYTLGHPEIALGTVVDEFLHRMNVLLSFGLEVERELLVFPDPPQKLGEHTCRN